MTYMADQEIMPLLTALDQAVMAEVAIVQDLPMVQVMEAQVPLTDLEVTAARQVLDMDLPIMDHQDHLENMILMATQMTILSKISDLFLAV